MLLWSPVLCPFLLQCGVVFAQIKNFVINTKSYQEKTALQLTRSLF